MPSNRSAAAKITAAQPPTNRITAKVMPSNRGAAAYNAAYQQIVVKKITFSAIIIIII